VKLSPGVDELSLGLVELSLGVGELPLGELGSLGSLGSNSPMISGPGPISCGPCLPMRIEEDNERFGTATTAMCKSSDEGSEEFHMTITIVVIAFIPGERHCQRGPAGQGQKNVGGDEKMHYRGRVKENGAARRDAKSGESWVVKIKSKWLCFCEHL
jgi:hypothetical protein